MPNGWEFRIVAAPVSACRESCWSLASPRPRRELVWVAAASANSITAARSSPSAPWP